MAAPPTTYTIFPLGDSAITLDLGNTIDELHNIRALAVQEWLQAHRFPGVLDIIVAYSSVSVFYDPAVVLGSGAAGSGGAAFWVEALLKRAEEEVLGVAPGDGGLGTGVPAGIGLGVPPGPGMGVPGGPGLGVPGGPGLGVPPGPGTGVPAGIGTGVPGGPTKGLHAAGRSFRIPVCYEQEFAPDLGWVAGQRGLGKEEVIRLHCTPTYRVYMIGFLPGFSYMGTVDERLQLPRKERPVPVAAGGVGIAGMQTGIYPLNSPGGWQIIGRTPLRLFNVDLDPPVYLQTGDHVQFFPISSDEFRELSARPI